MPLRFCGVRLEALPSRRVGATIVSTEAAGMDFYTLHPSPAQRNCAHSVCSETFGQFYTTFPAPENKDCVPASCFS